LALEELDVAAYAQPSLVADGKIIDARHRFIDDAVVPSRFSLVRKRAFDISVGTVMAVALTPVMLALALGSAVAYRAWPVFSHHRLGHKGETFRFMKIRSLPPTTPANIDKYELAAHTNNRWGSLLRATHLDELPQLWLVVAGRMSLVGPRPEMPGLASTFDPAFVQHRLSVPPGCTGLWQISPASAGLIGESPEYDLHYIHRWTVRLDLWILVRTVLTAAKKAGHATLHDIPSWTGAHFHRHH